jgi:hypothetical protein
VVNSKRCNHVGPRRGSGVRAGSSATAKAAAQAEGVDKAGEGAAQMTRVRNS